MSIVINIDKDRDLTQFTVMGEATLDELLTALKQIWEEEPTLFELWDFRAASGVRVSDEETGAIMEYIKNHSEKRSGGKTAFVATGELEYGMSRMAEAQVVIEGFPFQVKTFRSIEAAMAWLDSGD
jgi:hypothetical protein